MDKVASVENQEHCQINVYEYFFIRIYFPRCGQVVVTGVVPSSPRFLPSIFIAHRVQQSHCSSIFYRVLLTHALTLSASQFVHRQEKILTNFYEYVLGEARTHATDLYQARGQPDPPPGRPVIFFVTGLSYVPLFFAKKAAKEPVFVFFGYNTRVFLEGDSISVWRVAVKEKTTTVVVLQQYVMHYTNK